jgi:hypothetical protein
VALAAYAATFLVSAALVLFILGMAIAAVGIWVFIRGYAGGRADQPVRGASGAARLKGWK